MPSNKRTLEYFATTEFQRSCARLYVRGLSPSKIAEQIASSSGTVRKVIHRLKARQASVDPEVHSDEAPNGYRLKGVSTQRKDSQGNLQWVKTEKLPVINDPKSIIKLFNDAVADSKIPLATPKRAPDTSDDLLSIFPLGDPHFGLIASSMTSKGGDYNMHQSIFDVISGMKQLIDDTPPSKHALIVSVGDMYHADNETGVTPRSKHKLDTHTIWPEVVKAVFECLIRIVDLALQKHENVTVDLRPGNHDKMSTIFTQQSLAAYYRNEPRVTVVDNVKKVNVHVYGDILIATAHGDSPKSHQIPGVVATDYPQEWGRTRFRRAFVGHIHHHTLTSQDLTGMSVESLRIHSKRDSWTDDEGYRSERAMVADVYHLTEGHRRRYSVTFK